MPGLQKYSPTSRLTIDSGTIDILDSVPTAISGSVEALGPTTLVTAPITGMRIAVVSIILGCEDATSTLLQAHFGDVTTNGIRGVVNPNAPAIVATFPAGREWRGGNHEALNLTADFSYQCGYSVVYFTESV